MGYRSGMPAVSAVLERLATAVEGAAVLDRPASLAARVTGKLPPGKLKDLLSGTPLGHPLHPVLVTVPLGALAGATVLDASGADPRAARRLVGLSLLSSLPAAAAGASDWNDTNGAEQRVGVAHALVNTAGLALVAASWFRRREGGGRLSSLAGLSMLGASGWLGGHLSYAMGVGVDTTAFEHVPVEWTDACAEDDLRDGEPLAVTVGELPVLLVRRGAAITAIGNRCTHRGAPLSDGPLEGDCVTCPWHASQFDLATGAVVRGPATRPQPVLRVRIAEGRVQVCRDEQRALRKNPVT